MTLEERVAELEIEVKAQDEAMLYGFREHAKLIGRVAEYLVEQKRNPTTSLVPAARLEAALDNFMAGKVDRMNRPIKPKVPA